MEKKKAEKISLAVAILGLVLLTSGVVFQLYGVNHEKYSTLGGFLNSFGLMALAFAFIIYGIRKKE